MNDDTPQRMDPALARGNRFEAGAYAAKHFLWQVADGVATLTLNRPERKNPITFDSYAEMRDLFGQLRYASDVHAVVLHGAGGNFCSGGDVHEIIGPLIKLKAPELLLFTRMTGELVKAMRHCPQPIIAAIDGICAGAGAILAMASARSPITAARLLPSRSRAATIGCGQRRIALTSSPVMRVNISSSGVFSLISGPMISCTSPPEQKLPPAPCSTTAWTSSACRRRPNRPRISA